MQRIEKYMKEKEVPPWATSLSDIAETVEDSWSKTNGVAKPKDVGYTEAVLTWHLTTSREPFLLHLDAVFKPGLNLVIGHTGAGKVELHLIALHNYRLT